MALEVGLIGNGGTGGVETPPHKRGGTEGGEGCGGNGGWGNGAEMVTLERKGERTEGGDAREGWRNGAVAWWLIERKRERKKELW